MTNKRSLLHDKATATQKPKKSKNNDNDGEKTTKRGGRSKNFSVPDGTASLRGTLSAKAQGKKSSKAKIITEMVIPMEDQQNTEHERVVFLDNVTREPILQLYRKTEAAEPMADLWSDFIRLVQHPRDHYGAQHMSSILSQEESEAISLKNNADIFPTLITSKGGLRSKDNFQASTSNAQRGEGGTFSRNTVAATGPEILRSRAGNLIKKANALLKQADAYHRAAESMAEDAKAPEDTPIGKHGMTYIGDVLTLSRKEVNKYILDHEEHLTVTAEKLRSEMAGLAAFVHRAEKRLRDQIQTKIAADLKLCRDIKKFGHFELKSWQIAALPSGLHVCRCEECEAEFDPFDHSQPASIKLQYPEGGLPQGSRNDALPEIKVEDEDSRSLGTTIAQLGSTSDSDEEYSAPVLQDAAAITANPTNEEDLEEDAAAITANPTNEEDLEEDLDDTRSEDEKAIGSGGDEGFYLDEDLDNLEHFF